MAEEYYISKIKLPTGTASYDLRDDTARQQLETKTRFDIVVCPATASEIPQGAIYQASSSSTAIIGTLIAGDGKGHPSGSTVDTRYKIYFVLNYNAGAGNYIEWITINKGTDEAPNYVWEQFGSSAVDLKDYAKKGDAVHGSTSTDKTGITIDSHSHSLSASVLLSTTPLGSNEASSVTYDSTHVNTVSLLNNTPSAGSTTTPMQINESLFGKSSYAQGEFTRGELPQKRTADDFDANVPMKVDISKVNLGKVTTVVLPELTQGTNEYTPEIFPTLNTSVSGTTLTIGFNPGTPASFTYHADTYNRHLDDYDQGVAPTLGTGFYTPGTAATFTEGEWYLGKLPTHAADSYTEAKLKSGFYTAGQIGTNTVIPTFSAQENIVNVSNVGTAAAQKFNGDTSTASGTASVTGTINSHSTLINDPRHSHTLVNTTIDK